jgi:hypothetical protein
MTKSSNGQPPHYCTTSGTAAAAEHCTVLWRALNNVQKINHDVNLPSQSQLSQAPCLYPTLTQTKLNSHMHTCTKATDGLHGASPTCQQQTQLGKPALQHVGVRTLWNPTTKANLTSKLLYQPWPQQWPALHNSCHTVLTSATADRHNHSTLAACALHQHTPTP